MINMDRDGVFLNYYPQDVTSPWDSLIGSERFDKVKKLGDIWAEPFRHHDVQK